MRRRRSTHPRQLPRRSVLAIGPKNRETNGRRGRRPLHPRHLLALLANDCDYDDPGGDWFTKRTDTDKRRGHLIRQLKDLGYGVALTQPHRLTKGIFLT